MTQATQTVHRATVLTSALIAALVASVITVSALLIAPAILEAPSLTSAEQARQDRIEQAGLEWQARYEQMYPPTVDRLEQMGIDWQERYEQTNPAP